MKTEQAVHREVDLGLYGVNRAKFPDEELVPYRDMYIAFNWDGTEVLASGPDEDELVSRLQARGLPRGSYCVEWMGL